MPGSERRHETLSLAYERVELTDPTEECVELEGEAPLRREPMARMLSLAAGRPRAQDPSALAAAAASSRSLAMARRLSRSVWCLRVAEGVRADEPVSPTAAAVEEEDDPLLGGIPEKAPPAPGPRNPT